MHTVKYARKDRRSKSKDIGTIKELFWKRGKDKERVSFKELKVIVNNLGILKKCTEKGKEIRRIT